MSEMFTFNPGEMNAAKCIFCSKMTILKSLYPDLLPSVELKLKCKVLENNDMCAVLSRISHAAYLEYNKIMIEEMEKAHGFPAVGTWETEPEKE